MDRLISKIASKSEQEITITDCDYKNDDGLWMCGKCHTPKQVRVEVLGRVMTPLCLCKCESEKPKPGEVASKQLELKSRIETNRNNAFAGIPITNSINCIRNWKFDIDDGSMPDITSRSKKYVEVFDDMIVSGKGILFYGNTGTGKTFQSVCIANALLDKGYTVAVTSFGRIERESFNNRQQYLDELNRNQLIVIDDYGTERYNDYMQEIVYSVIDYRCKIGLPFIVTSNMNADEFKNPKTRNDKRIMSRILDRCVPILIKGEDRRLMKK